MEHKNSWVTTVLGSLAAFVGGCGLACQASINGAAAKPLKSPFAATSLSFYVGVFSLLLTAYWSLGLKKKPPSGGEVYWWFYVVPGAIGAFYVSMGTIIGPKFGFSLFFVFVVIGQLMTALYIDHRGVLDTPRSGVTKSKFAALAIVLTGSILAVAVGREGGEGSVEDNPGLLFLYAIVSMTAGCCVSMQVPVTTTFTRRKGTLPHRTALLAFSVGMVIVSIIWGVASAVDPDIREPSFDELEWWMCLGGAMGAFYVFLSVLLGHVLGVALFFISVVAGQLTMSMAIDSAGLFRSQVIEITVIRIVGVVLVFIGAVVFRIDALMKMCKTSSTSKSSSKSSKKGSTPTDASFQVLGRSTGDIEDARDLSRS